MGLLDQVLGGMGGAAPRRAGLGDTVAAGVVLALLVKAVHSYQAKQAGAPAAAAGGSPSVGAPSGGLGGLGGILGGALGGGGGGLGGLGNLGNLGGLLGGLGGAGALGSLISHLQQGPLAAQANSWLGTGANQPVEPAQLGGALGENTLKELEQHTGLPRDQLLSELSHLLPQALDTVTPQGRAPTDDELHQVAQQPAG